MQIWVCAITCKMFGECVKEHTVISYNVEIRYMCIHVHMYRGCTLCDKSFYETLMDWFLLLTRKQCLDNIKKNDSTHTTHVHVGIGWVLNSFLYIINNKFRQCLELKIFQCKQHVTVSGTLLLNVAILSAKICTGELAQKYLWYVLGWYMQVFPLATVLHTHTHLHFRLVKVFTCV